ncbi:hypothetical protein [Terricaulis sp.]|uniref:hypothetical protein n=1 Tax=Terricaulis sp. TaxID=2768686 RepID=UPI003782D8C6
MAHALKALFMALALGAGSLACEAAAQTRTAEATDSIAGSAWRGAFDSVNDYTISYRFNADGSAEWSDNGRDGWRGKAEHRWTQDGASVAWTHTDGTRWSADLRGGGVMTGVIYGPDGEPRGVFRLTRQ